MIYALKDGEELAVTEISVMLGQTHPAVNQVANVLVKKGLAEERKDASDQRKRLLKLSPNGHQLVEKMNGTWDRIKEANDHLLKRSASDLLSTLDNVESALDDQSMYERVRSRG